MQEEWNETYRHFGPGLLPQGRGLPVGLSGAHAGSRIHPFDRRGPLRRRLHDQLGIERVSRACSGAPATGPASRLAGAAASRRSRSRSAGSSASPPTSRTTSASRLPKPAAKKNGKRIALVGGGPASLTVARDLAPMGYDCVVFDQDPQSGGMMRTQIPKFRLPESVHRRGMRLHPRSRRRVRRRQAHRQHEGAAGRKISTRLRRLRRAARPRSRHSRPQGSGQEHPYRHRLAVQRLVRPHRPGSASASSCSAAATPPWIAAAPRAVSAART